MTSLLTTIIGMKWVISMSNYPDYTWEQDPRAPWNEPVPWLDKKCLQCSLFAPIPKDICNTTMGYCVECCDYFNGEDDACDSFELYQRCYI